MRRREFITVLGGTAAMWPLATRAQTQRKMARIGYLGAGIRNVTPNPRDAFLQGLRDRGYVEGQNFVLVDRYAEGQQERAPELATELVSSRWISSWPRPAVQQGRRRMLLRRSPS